MVTKRDREVKKDEGSSSSLPDTGKLWVEEQPDSGGMDELLEALGYKVRSSDMADVAQKLEELEMAMGSSTQDGSSVLSNDTVHFNPSDLSGWVDSMLSELNNENEPNDLQAIFGNQNKKIKPMSPEPPQPILVMDSQETGVRLVHALLACAESIQQNNLSLANALLKHVGILAVAQAGPMRKVATYFAEALARRIYGIYPQDSFGYGGDLLQMHFYETCPYLKFAHFTANQAILEAFGDSKRVHVVDFSLKQGMQWPSLIEAMSIRKDGPPVFKLTAIGSNNECLQQVGWKLGQLSGSLGVPFEFQVRDLDVEMIKPDENETLAVNSIFEFHKLLGKPGGIETVLGMVKEMRPKIVTIVEQEANHNVGGFVNRFNEALNYYCTMFDSLDGCGSGGWTADLVMSEMYLGREICNVVACEGVERVERHEDMSRWKGRMGAAGFEGMDLGSDAFKQASMLLEVFNGGGGYTVEEKEGCLMLDWQTRPLVAAAAFRLAEGV